MDKILYEKHAPLVRITINRPGVMNALDRDAFRRLKEALQTFDADRRLHVAVLTGAGDRAFSAGADLKEMARHEGTIEEFWNAERQDRLGQRFTVTKPVIAAINGYCLAGGLELALACDVRIASATASFGCPEVRWGILHGFGAIRLPRTVALSVAMEMLLTGEPISAARAYEVGLVSRVVDPPMLGAAAQEIAERIARNGPLAVRITKELAWRALHQSPDDALRLYGAATALIHQTGDAKEGPRAFAEKRAPRFTGR